MSAGARAGSPVARLVAPARDAARFLRDALALLGETAAKGDLSWFRVGPRRFYLVNDLDLIEEVLATRHGPLRRQGGYEERRFAGDSLFSEEEPVHGERRRVLEPVFDPEAIESYGAWMGRRATEFARAWPAGGEVNVAEEMDRLTLGIMTAAEFGEGAGPEATRVVEDAFRGSRETFGRVRMPHTKLLWALPLPAGRRYLAARWTTPSIAPSPSGSAQAGRTTCSAGCLRRSAETALRG